MSQCPFNSGRSGIFLETLEVFESFVVHLFPVELRLFLLQPFNKLNVLLHDFFGSIVSDFLLLILKKLRNRNSQRFLLLLVGSFSAVDWNEFVKNSLIFDFEFVDFSWVFETCSEPVGSPWASDLHRVRKRVVDHCASLASYLHFLFMQSAFGFSFEYPVLVFSDPIPHSYCILKF